MNVRHPIGCLAFIFCQKCFFMIKWTEGFFLFSSDDSEPSQIFMMEYL